MRTGTVALALTLAIGAAARAGAQAPAPATSPTASPPPAVAPNAAQGDGALPTPTATPTPARTPKPKRKRERKPPRAPEAPALPPPPVAPGPVTPIDSFRIPPFLLPVYQAAGIEYGVRWEVLAAINEIETDYGRNLNVSSAGALGWMQFMPRRGSSTASTPTRTASRIPTTRPTRSSPPRATSRRPTPTATSPPRSSRTTTRTGTSTPCSSAPAGSGAATPLVGSLTGLAEARFPIDAPARYARGPRGDPTSIEPRRPRSVIEIRARRGAAAVAVSDGRIVAIGTDAAGRGRIRLRDAAGNTFDYDHLAKVAESYPALRPLGAPTGRAHRAPPRKQRLFAHPARPNARAAGGARQLAARAALPRIAGRGPLPREDYVARPLALDARVSAGTVLGRLGGATSSVRFAIRPAGTRARRIDPVPILDGWRLLAATAGALTTPANPLAGQIALMDQGTLERRVLADPRITVYACGRRDIAHGLVDRRVLATLEILATSGLEPTVSSLRCGHGRLTSSGNVSEHVSGNAVDIAALNGVPIAGNQGPGSITELALKRLRTLQGPLEPHQIISLMRIDGARNAFALADHADHIHVGWRPGALSPGAEALGRDAWARLSDRLSAIDSPTPAPPPRPARRSG